MKLEKLSLYFAWLFYFRIRMFRTFF